MANLLTTEYVEIPKGVGWTPIELGDSIAFDVQNIAEVMMEYTFTDDVRLGSYLTPYTVVLGIQQTVYVRFRDVQQNGAISVTRTLDVGQ
jgi:hypothetical protein